MVKVVEHLSNIFKAQDSITSSTGYGPGPLSSSLSNTTVGNNNKSNNKYNKDNCSPSAPHSVGL